MNTLCLSVPKFQTHLHSGCLYVWVTKQAILHCLVIQSAEYLPFEDLCSFFWWYWTHGLRCLKVGPPKWMNAFWEKERH